jgi:hypothetical protein
MNLASDACTYVTHARSVSPTTTDLEAGGVFHSMVQASDLPKPVLNSVRLGEFLVGLEALMFSRFWEKGVEFRSTRK